MPAKNLPISWQNIQWQLKKKNSINVGHRLHYWYVTILLYYITILQYGNGDAVVIDNRDYYYCRMAAIGYITIYDYD